MTIMAAVQIVGKLIDKVLPDKEKAAELKSQIAIEAMNSDAKELQAMTSVILAEAGGESWLQRNWRPIMMLWFAGLIGAHWLGFTPENLTQDSINRLLAIVQVGIGGYIVGRSGEKIMKMYKEK